MTAGTPRRSIGNRDGKRTIGIVLVAVLVAVPPLALGASNGEPRAADSNSYFGLANHGSLSARLEGPLASGNVSQFPEPFLDEYGQFPLPASSPALQPYVARTLVLFNNTLMPGNFLARNGEFPEAGAYDQSKGEVFVSDFGSKMVDVINDTTNKVVSALAVGSGPLGLAYDPKKGEMFVANYNSNTISVINDSSNVVVATIEVGSLPCATTYDSRQGEILVANGNSNNVSVINGSSNKVFANIPVGVGPSALAYDSGKGETFVANYNANSLSVISDATNTVVRTISVGLGPDGVATDPAKGEVFVVNFGAASPGVMVINDTTDSVVASIGVGANPVAVAVDRGKGEAFVSNSGTKNVSVINDATDRVVATIAVAGEIASYDGKLGEVFVANSVYNVSVINDTTNAVSTIIQVGSSPYAIAYDSASRELFVANVNSNELNVVSTLSNSTVGTVRGGDDHYAIAYDSGTGELFVTNYVSDDVTIVNATTMALVGTIPGLRAPDGIVYDPSKSEVLVANYIGDTVSVVNDSTASVVAKITVGGGPSGLIYDSGRGEVFAIDYSTNNVSVINDTTNRVVANVSVGNSPLAGAYDMRTGEVFVANYNSNTVSVINDSSNLVVATVPVGGGPSGLAFDDQAREVFVSNDAASNVSVIGDQSNAVVSTFIVGNSPVGIAYDPAADLVYICNYGQGTLSIVSPHGYPVTFTESGLPPSTPWWVNLTEGESYESTGTSITFGEPNGSYSFMLSADNNTYASPGGSFQVTENPVSEQVTFSLMAYGVTFTEFGLPPGTEWWANVSGQTPQNSVGTTIALKLPNGTYTYSVATSNKSYSSSGGRFTVDGAAVSKSVTFSLVTYSVTFTEYGLPSETEWFVNLTGGSSSGSATDAITFNEPNGTYLYTVATSDKKYAAVGGTFTVNGASVPKSVTFVLVTYSVVFTETGLPSGTNWSVVVGGVTESFNSTEIAILEPNGSYAFAVGSVPGYAVNRSGGTVQVNGAGAVESLTFTSTSKGTTILGLPPAEGYTVVAGIVVAVIVAALAVGLFARRRKGKTTAVPPLTPSPPPTHPEG